MFLNKNLIAASILFTFIVFTICPRGEGIQNLPGTNESINDSLQTAIQDKINFYQSEQKKNMEEIESIQKELEQRRALNERLNGAVAASREILTELQEKGGEQAGKKNK